MFNSFEHLSAITAPLNPAPTMSRSKPPPVGTFTVPHSPDIIASLSTIGASVVSPDRHISSRPQRPVTSFNLAHSGSARPTPTEDANGPFGIFFFFFFFFGFPFDKGVVVVVVVVVVVSLKE
jgi:hypothetical protein